MHMYQTSTLYFMDDLEWKTSWCFENEVAAALVYNIDTLSG